MKLTIIDKGSIISTNPNLFENFFKFLQKKYPLKGDMTMYFLNERIGHMTTGSRGTNNVIKVLVKNRINRDILRTVAHEWVHEYQRTIMNLDKGPDIGGFNEDMANSESGKLIKMFEKQYPDLEENMYD
jgi:hypothetical protein